VDVRRLLHHVRAAAAAAPLDAALAPADWVVYASNGGAWRLDDHGAPPFPPGPIDAAQLHDLLFAADDAGLDLRGEVCPYTFVRTRLALEALPLGARLRVTVDHAPARRNIPRSAAEWGQEVASVDDGPGPIWTIVLIKRVC
jgi:tRNA 2-thiouridine synthesizing protein A